MKKHWLTAIIMAVLLLAQAVAACGGALADEADEPCTHEWSDWKSTGTQHERTCNLCQATEQSGSACWWNEDVWKYNATHHWHPCIFEECKVRFGKAEHTFVNGVCACGYKQPHEHQWATDWSSDESGHWHACTVEGCGWTYGEAEHIWGNWVGTATSHERECKVCHYVESVDHGEDVYNAGKCDICGFTMHGAQDEWKYDETNHWHECLFKGCTEMLDKAEHDWTDWEGVATGHKRECKVCHYVESVDHGEDVYNAGKCDICGFTMHGAQDEWKYDEHTHWHECKFAGCEEKFNEEQHVIIGGKCKCGYEQKHEFSDEWSSDETHHWHACTVEGCGWTYDEAEHTWGEWIAEGTFHERECTVCHRVQHENHDLTDGKCEICGFTMHGAQDEWKNDENTHWHGCKFDGCEEKFDEAEHTWGEWIAEGTFHERECTVCHRVQHENHDLTDGKCDICGFTMHGAQNEWKNDEHTHWHECKFDGCTDKLGENEHDLVNGVCRVCGYGKIDYPVYDDVQPIVSAPLPPQTGDASYLAIGIGMIAAALCIALRKRQSN